MDFVVQTIADAYHALHQQLRATLADASPAALAWTPGPETNPVSVLVIHTLGSQGEVWRVVAGEQVNRDRDAEFVPGVLDAASLSERIAAADRLIDDLAPKLTGTALANLVERPPRTPQTGLYWLLINYGHAREHLAHIELTLQLYPGA